MFHPNVLTISFNLYPSFTSVSVFCSLSLFLPLTPMSIKTNMTPRNRVSILKHDFIHTQQGQIDPVPNAGRERESGRQGVLDKEGEKEREGVVAYRERMESYRQILSCLPLPG
ncbi:unnamed protein product [Boreogadus saida]